MKTQTAVLVALSATVSAHGVVTQIEGANGVVMPGLTIADGTPRDCSSNGCGSQADTAIIRDREITSGQCGPLGRTQGNGPVDAAVMIRNFMGAGAAPTNNGTGVGVEDKLPARVGARALDEEEEEVAAVAPANFATKVARQIGDILGAALKARDKKGGEE